MALITQFNRKIREKYSTHDGIEADYYVLGDGQAKLVQIDTQGSSTRENPNKQSQTIQLSRTSAKSLFDILKAEFHF